MYLWHRVFGSLIRVARERTFFFCRAFRNWFAFLLSSILLISTLLFTFSVIATTAIAQEQQVSSSGLNQLILQGQDPRLSRKVPDTLAAKVALTPILREVPVPTEPREISLQNRKAVIFPNIRMHPSSTTTQSEMSIWTHPVNPNIVLAGSNAAHTSISVVSQGWYYTTDGGTSWLGGDTLPTHTNLSLFMSDPAVGIDLDENLFFNALLYGSGTSNVIIARSTDNGTTWNQATVPSPSTGKDKNHLTVDRNPGSSFENYLYTAYTDFNPFPSPIMLSRSTNRGLNFSSPVSISGSIGSQFAQGINLAVGPNSELYASWSGYDSWPPPVVTRLGFNKSTDGGVTWQTAKSIRTVNDIRGTLNKGGNLVRVNSFPSMAVDRSTGSRQGWIYIVYPEKNPTTPDIFLIHSTDGGNSWSSPQKVNQDNSGKDQWFPWISVDPTTGALYVVYYDSRNFPANDSAQVYVSSSLDGGVTFEDVLVSDMAFLPTPIPGLASGYMGDYIGISALNGVVWPCWNDNRTGIHQAYTSRIVFIEVGSPPKISVSPDTLDFGNVFLGYSETLSVSIRNLGFPETLLVTDIQSSSADFIPETTSFALPGGSGRSVKVAFSPSDTALINATLTITSSDTANPTVTVALRGKGLLPPDIVVSPASLSESLFTGETAVETLTISNTGFSDLNFDISIQGVTAPSVYLKVIGDKDSMIPTEEFTLVKSRDELLKFPQEISGEMVAQTSSYGAEKQISSSKVLNSSIPADILLITTTSVATSVEQALTNLGKVYDLVATVDFTGIDFSPYTTLMVAMDGGLISEASVQALANAAQSGKRLIILGGTNYSPYYTGVQTYLLSHTGQQGWVISSTPHLQVIDPSHPLAAGLPSSYNFINSAAAFYMLRINDVNAPVAARNGDGHPILVNKTIGSGSLIYFTNSPYESYWQNASDFAILQTVINNALSFQNWLTLNPNSDTIPAGSSVDIEVTFDATGLNGGDYYANILISSNDPDEPQDTTPVHLHVTGAPDIAVSDTILDYDSVFTVSSATETLVVSNIGTDLLTVSNIVSDNPVYTVDTTNFSLNPGEKQNILVTFTPPDTGLFTGNLTISSNDPDEASVIVSLQGIGLLPPDIAVSPASLSESLFTGETAIETLTIANTGFSDLNFTIKNQSASLQTVQDQIQLHPITRVSKLPVRTITILPASTYGGNSYDASQVPRVVPVTIIDSSLHILTIDLGVPENYQVLDLLGIAYVKLSPAAFDTVNLFNYDVLYVGWTAGASFIGMQSLYNRRNDISTFVQAGGGLVALSNPPTTPYAWQWVPVTVTSVGIDAELVHITEPTHPVMDSLTDALLSYWGNSYHNTFSTYDPALQSIAIASDGGNEALTLAGQLGAGRIVLTGQDPDYHFVFGGQTGAAILLRNMLRWVGKGIVGWLSETPTSGIVPADSSMDIEVTFDATGLNGGDYYANILISSNDPDEPIDTTPVHLHVTGAPDIAISDTILDYDSVFTVSSATETLVVSNIGTDLLTVSNIVSDNPNYTVDTTNFSLNPGEKQYVLVTFTPPDTGLFTGNLTISSNDPDEASVIVSLQGIGLLPPDITVSPASLSESLFTGETAVETLTISNTGFSDLNFNISFEGVTAAVVTELTNRLQSNNDENPRRDNSKDIHRTDLKDYETPKDSQKANSSVASVPIPFFDSFEDGNYNGWTEDFGVGIREVTSATAAHGIYSFYYQNTTTGHFHGIHQDFTPGSQPEYVSFYVRSGSDSLADAYFVLAGDDPNVEAIFFLAAPNGFFYVNGDNSYLYNANQWYFIEFKNIDWTNKNFDYYVDRNLVKADINFRFAGSANQFSRLYLYNYHAPNAWWDGINIGSAVNWLSVNPTSGKVPAGSTVNIEVTFDATGLNGGDYYANILISSNDPDEPQDTTPVHLHVTGAPDIAVSDTILDYDSVFTVSSATETLVVSNIGTDLLTVSNIVSDNPVYTVDTTNFNLNPGQKQNVLVTFTPSDTGLFTGNLTILSNDPDEASVIVSLQGIGLLPPDITVSPASLSESLFTGEIAIETLTISNTGFSDLNFDILIEGVPAAALSLEVNSTEWKSNSYGDKLEGANKIGGFEASSNRIVDNGSSGASENRLSIANPSNAKIANAGDVIRTIPAPGNTLGLTWLNSNLWAVVATSPQKIVQLNPADGSIISSFNIGFNAHLGLANDGSDLWVCNFSSGTIEKYNTSGTLLTSWPAPNSNAVRGIAWDGSALWVGGASSGLLYRVDTNGNILETRTLSTAIISWAMDMEWVPQHPAGQLWIIDDGSFNDVNQFKVSLEPPVLIQDFAHPAPSSIPEGVAHDGRNMWISGFLSSVIFLVDDGVNEIISVNPDSGVVPAGSSIDIAVTFDATGLNGGDYYANILISSNDPDEPQDTTPVHLHVTGAPDIAVSDTILDYGSVFVGASVSETLVVSNKGTDLLTVSNIVSDNPNYTVDTTNFSLNPGQKQNVLVTFTPNDTGLLVGQLTIASNDSDETNVIVQLVGSGLYPPVITVTPDSFALTLVEGDSTKATMTVGNTGLGNLNWQISGVDTVAAPVNTDTLSAMKISTSIAEGDEQEGISQKSLLEINRQIESISVNLTDLTGKRIGITNIIIYNTIVTDLQTRGANVTGFSFPINLAILDSLDVLAVDDAISSASSSDINAIRNWLQSGKGLLLQGEDAASITDINALLVGTGISEINIGGYRNAILTNILFHSTTVGVDTIKGGSYGSYCTVIPPAQTIVFDDLFRPHAAVSKLGAGRVIAVGNEVSADGNLTLGDTRLFANQVFDWLAGVRDFLSVTPGSGTIPSGATQELMLKMNTINLIPGNYGENINIISNDPLHPQVRIPVRLTVEIRCTFKPGDVTGDELITLADIVTLINHLFKRQPAPDPLCRADVTANGKVSVSDLVYLINFWFRSGPAPLKSGACCL